MNKVLQVISLVSFLVGFVKAGQLPDRRIAVLKDSRNNNILVARLRSAFVKSVTGAPGEPVANEGQSTKTTGGGEVFIPQDNKGTIIYSPQTCYRGEDAINYTLSNGDTGILHIDIIE